MWSHTKYLKYFVQSLLTTSKNQCDWCLSLQTWLLQKDFSHSYDLNLLDLAITLKTMNLCRDSLSPQCLTLIWVDFLGVCFKVRWGKITLCLKPVEIILGNCSKHAPIFSFKKYTFSYQRTLNLADVSIFLEKVCTFLQNSTFRVLLEYC